MKMFFILLAGCIAGTIAAHVIEVEVSRHSSCSNRPVEWAASEGCFTLQR